MSISESLAKLIFPETIFIEGKITNLSEEDGISFFEIEDGFYWTKTSPYVQRGDNLRFSISNGVFTRGITYKKEDKYYRKAKVL
tara:strand:+ start:309 stop:560 length:252 start_codon:yes stop_codon:yes gene_type:complete